MKIRRLSEALAARQTVHDADFDDLFPLAYRRVSARFWTPVETARRATDLLVREGAQRILDVGAGVGKFCIVGAATTARASFVGIEQRAHLVNVARDAAATLGVTDLEVVHGRLDQIDTSTFDGFYFSTRSQKTFLCLHPVWTTPSTSRSSVTATTSRSLARSSRPLPHAPWSRPISDSVVKCPRNTSGFTSNAPVAGRWPSGSSERVLVGPVVSLVRERELRLRRLHRFISSPAPRVLHHVEEHGPR